jgi:hypothetical protein
VVMQIVAEALAREAASLAQSASAGPESLWGAFGGSGVGGQRIRSGVALWVMRWVVLVWFRPDALAWYRAWSARPIS